MSFRDELIQYGIWERNADVLEKHFGTEPDFIAGLEQIAEGHLAETKPGKVPPAGEPWKTVYNDVINSNGNKKNIKQVYNDSLAALDPALQMALHDALSKAWHKIIIVQPLRKRKHVKSRDYIQVLGTLGYKFRMNACNDEIEVNSEPISDPLRAKIRSKLRDAGYPHVHVAEDAYTAQAYDDQFHPVREYFDALGYDGEQHIATLAGFFQDEHGVFETWLRRWLIGAVAKVMSGEQNAMLVLDGPQGCGKSHFASWLCPLRAYFTEGPVNPDDKDCQIRLISKWIWEVAELGATTRKADREALKGFISRQMVTVRKPYGRHDIHKSAMASMVGTVNNEAGILTDKTGNRRFVVCKVEDIDWAYSSQVDVHQVWAEAQALYFAGEPGQLTTDEQKQAQEINAEYEVDDPVEGLLLKYFEVNSSIQNWTPTADILQTLELNGLRGNTRANSMALAGVLTKLGMQRERRRTGGGSKKSGYWGIRLII